MPTRQDREPQGAVEQHVDVADCARVHGQKVEEGNNHQADVPVLMGLSGSGTGHSRMKPQPVPRNNRSRP